MSMTASTIKLARPAPYGQGAAITPNDLTTFTNPYDAIVCQGDGGSIGSVTVDFHNGGGADVEIPVFWGIVVPILIDAVKSTGTNADSVIGLKHGSAS